MDLIGQSWKAHPGMHVYHYAPYEPSAFKRLMGRYATREEELDTLLRAERFVDLYGVVRQGLLAGIERYSIKNLEVFYAFVRAVALADASRSLLRMEQALELHCAIDRGARGPRGRAGLQPGRLPVRAPPPQLAGGAAGRAGSVRHCGAAAGGAAGRGVGEGRRARAAGRRRFGRGCWTEFRRHARTASDEQQARWLLAYLLDWHRREDKAGWWEYYRLRDLPEEDLFDEPQAVAGLRFVERVRSSRT